MSEEVAAQQLPYGTDYAKSSRSNCKGCKTNIEKGDLRMSARSQSRFFDGLQDNWFHFDCFWGRAKSDINEAMIRGFSWLKWEDQEKIRARAQVLRDNPNASSTPRTYTPKVEPAKSGAGKCFKCKEKIAKAELRISYRTSFYHVECFFQEDLFTDDVEKIIGFDGLSDEDKARISSLLPEKKVEKRKLDSPPEEAKENKKAKLDSKEERMKLKEQTKLLWDVLENLRSMPKEAVVELLEANNSIWGKGGVESNLEQLADRMVFGTPRSCEKCGGNYRYSESAHGYVCTGSVSEYTKCRDFQKDPKRKPFKAPDHLREAFPFLEEYHKKKEVAQRFFSSVVENTKIETPQPSKINEKRFERRLAEEEKRRVVKNGCVVDPQCEMSSETHVFVQKKRPWQALLNSADAASGKNSFYKLQLLQHDRREQFYVFRSWGRTGTTIGGNKTEEFEDLEAAQHVFTTLFLEKTGNEWAKRDRFQKLPGRMDLVDMDYDERAGAGELHMDPQKSSSALPMPVKEVISLFFDTKLMNEALCEFELDVEKMPLGKLSHKHLLGAHSVLSEIEKLILSGSSDKTAFLDLSNKFFTLIPHSVGIKKLPIIDNMELLKTKTEMLDSLLEMEMAYKMVKEEKQEEEAEPVKVDHIDRFYNNLGCDIRVMPSGDPMVKLINKFAKNTHGQTHDFQLDIKQVFEINRHGEADQFAKDIPNHMLLWHGSRLTNFAGILHQGLRIAPPEAPANGYMFGKGVYFADMISKSAQYCGGTRRVDAFLLLCEVALGQMQVEKTARAVEKPNPGFHSVKGPGGTAPDPAGAVTLPDGVVVPCGKRRVLSKSQEFSLLYNEYIVYDVRQIRMRYLVRASIRN